MDAVLMRAGDKSHAFSLGIEARVLEKTPRKVSAVIRSNIEPDQTVLAVAEPWRKEIVVLCEKGDTGQAMQHRDDIRILQAQIADLVTN